MSITCDKCDLLWLFESEPINDSDELLAGIMDYSIADNNGFELSLGIDIYAEHCSIILSFNEMCIFHAWLEKVTSLIKYEDKEELIVSVKNEPLLKLKFKKDFCIELIPDKEKETYKYYCENS